MSEHMCPRRDEVPCVYTERNPGPDSWESGCGLITQVSGCTWCGSMNPDDFMKSVRAGTVIGPTDKSYKLYVGGSGAEGKFYTRHLSPEQGREFYQLWRSGKVNWSSLPYSNLYLPGPSDDALVSGLN